MTSWPVFLVGPHNVPADVEMMSLREQNAKLRDQIATLVFQQCLSANPPRQNPSDAQQPSSPLSASHILRADSGHASAQSTMALARMPSANLAQSTLLKAPSGASQMLTHQSGVSQLMSPQQMSQQMSEERKRCSQAVSVKDDRIKELDDQLKALKQAQRAESKTYKNRSAADLPHDQGFCFHIIYFFYLSFYPSFYLRVNLRVETPALSCICTVLLTTSPAAAAQPVISQTPPIPSPLLQPPPPLPACLSDPPNNAATCQQACTICIQYIDVSEVLL